MQMGHLDAGALGQDVPRVGPHEVVLSVTLFQAEKNARAQEFNVLGSQPLHALRDRLVCQSDRLMEMIYAAKSSKSSTDSEDVPTSSFFFIEGVFYSDARSALNQNYATPLVKWASESTMGANDTIYRESTMDRRFDQLTIRLGKQYCTSVRACMRATAADTRP